MLIESRAWYNESSLHLMSCVFLSGHQVCQYISLFSILMSWLMSWWGGWHEEKTREWRGHHTSASSQNSCSFKWVFVSDTRTEVKANALITETPSDLRRLPLLFFLRKRERLSWKRLSWNFFPWDPYSLSSFLSFHVVHHQSFFSVPTKKFLWNYSSSVLCVLVDILSLQSVFETEMLREND